MIVVGSKAVEILTERDPALAGLLSRKPQDIDLVGRFEELHLENGLIPRLTAAGLVKRIDHISERKTVVHLLDGQIIEFEIAWSDTTAYDMLNWIGGFHKLDFYGHKFGVHVPPLSHLYMLKMSQRYLRNSPHFLKTMADIKQMRKYFATDSGLLNTVWFKKREHETYNYGHPKLDVKKGDFFSGDGVQYVYDHDTIHLAMRHLAQPAYESFRRPGSDVMCDRKMFEEAPYYVRLLSVLEEAQVLALERSQIPFGSRWTPERSFFHALEKVCTSITSGWWREFAWENYDSVALMYEPDYVRRFWSAVEYGVVKLHSGGGPIMTLEGPPNGTILDHGDNRIITPASL